MKKTLIIILLLALGKCLQAQEAKQYISILGGSGIHNLQYNFEDKANKYQNSVGYLLDLKYSYFFSSRMGISTGVGISTYSGLADMNSTYKHEETDLDGQLYEFRSKFNHWNEKQSGLFVDVPLALLFRLNSGKKNQLLFGIGGKASFPVKSTYKVTGGDITTSGYYSQWNIEFVNLPKYGFTTISNQPKGDLTLKPSYALTADLGNQHRLNDHLGAYVGGYINYGLNNISKSNDKPIYQSDGTYNGVLNSSLIGRVKQLSYGLKVGLSFALGQKKKNQDQIIVTQKTTNTSTEKEPSSNIRSEAETVEPVKQLAISDNKEPNNTNQDQKNANNKVNKSEDEEPIVIQERVKIVRDNSNESDRVQLKKYSVVIGSFKNKGYALRLKGKMERKGHKIILALNEKGMLRVIIATFDNAMDAVKECKSIKNKYAPLFYDIWILKKKADIRQSASK